MQVFHSSFGPAVNRRWLAPSRSTLKIFVLGPTLQSQWTPCFLYLAHSMHEDAGRFQVESTVLAAVCEIRSCC